MSGTERPNSLKPSSLVGPNKQKRLVFENLMRLERQGSDFLKRAFLSLFAGVGFSHT